MQRPFFSRVPLVGTQLLAYPHRETRHHTGACNPVAAELLPAPWRAVNSRNVAEEAALVGGKMIRPLGLVLALVIFGSASPAKAGTSTNVKCATNEDRVWVYENLDDFNLAAKLKCGDPVQVESRVKGYVKIQTADGTEGYVLDSALPKSALPPAPEEKPNTVEAASLAFAAKRAARSATPTVSSAPPASPAPAAVVASSAPAPTSASTAPVVVAARTTPVAPAAPSHAAPAAAQPAVAIAAPAPAPAPIAPAPAPAAAAPAPSPVYVSQPVTAPASAPAAASVSASSNAPAVASVSSVSHASSVAVETTVAPSQPAPPAPTVAAKYSNPQPIAPSRAKKHKTPTAEPVQPTTSTSQPAVAAQTAPSQPPPAAPPARMASPVAHAPVSSVSEVSSDAASQPSSMAASRVEPAENAAMAENSASMEPVSSPADQPAPVRAAKPPVNPDDDEDSAVHQLEEDTANCAHYFSAYGLSPNQYKWLAQNRHKAFPSVCPAPTPAMVDFVVIFTHDVAFYNVTMPDTVHVEQNGFSDWTPLSTVDTALMTPSEADKSHHEYVWVFHTTRGAFDPSKFSSHRRPLYSKSETNTLGSRGGFRTVMDALTFIEQNGTNR